MFFSQFAQLNIAQLEKTRTSHQNQIQSLESQVNTLEVTVQSLGNYVLQITDKHHNIELPGEIRRIVQQILHQQKQAAGATAPNSVHDVRKKVLFSDRKIGKSMSVNSQLGFPLKVLEEQNECDSPVKTATKTQFFENTLQQMRENNKPRPSRLDPTQKIIKEMKLPDHVEKALQSITTSPIQPDSGIATPISPKSVEATSQPTTGGTSIISIPLETMTPDATPIASEMHPLSNCGDVNFKFNGTTTQLKSIRPIHLQHRNSTVAATNHTIDVSKNGRS